VATISINVLLKMFVSYSDITKNYKMFRDDVESGREILL